MSKKVKGTKKGEASPKKEFVKSFNFPEGDSVTTADLIQIARRNSGISKVSIKKGQKAFEEALLEAIRQGKTIRLAGMMILTPTYRESRRAKNILTGKPQVIPESVCMVVRTKSKIKRATKDLNPADFKPEIKK